MILLLIAAQALQAQPIAKPVTPVVHPSMFAVITPAARKRRMIGDAQALLNTARRASESYSPVAGQATKAELEASMDKLKADADSLSEMSEMDSLRLQMMMDRTSKLMSELSNIMKKVSDTSENIANNMK